MVHAAGMNSKDCVSDPQGAHLFNGFSTGQLVKAASQKSVEKFMYISTAHVYSDQLIGSIDENTTAKILTLILPISLVRRKFKTEP